MGLRSFFFRKGQDAVLGAPQEPDAGSDAAEPRRPWLTTASRRSTSITINGEEATPEQVGEFERSTGLDLDGDGRIAGGEPAPPGGLGDLLGGVVGGDPAAERVALLERLSALRANGTLTEAEFEAEKARILGSR